MSAITMDTVRDLIERHSDHISGNTREFYNGAYAEIADELNSRADYHGYEQAAIEAWESVKAWNSRVERTCRVEQKSDRYGWHCECGNFFPPSVPPRNYCPNCGRKVEA